MIKKNIEWFCNLLLVSLSKLPPHRNLRYEGLCARLPEGLTPEEINQSLKYLESEGYIKTQGNPGHIALPIPLISRGPNFLNWSKNQTHVIQNITNYDINISRMSHRGPAVQSQDMGIDYEGVPEDISRLLKEIEKIIINAEDIDSQKRKEYFEDIDSIANEVKRARPRRDFLKSILNTLKDYTPIASLIIQLTKLSNTLNLI